MNPSKNPAFGNPMVGNPAFSQAQLQAQLATGFQGQFHHPQAQSIMQAVRECQISHLKENNMADLKSFEGEEKDIDIIWRVLNWKMKSDDISRDLLSKAVEIFHDLWLRFCRTSLDASITKYLRKKLLGRVDVKTLVLHASNEVKCIWTNKCRFQMMDVEEVQKRLLYDAILRDIGPAKGGSITYAPSFSEKKLTCLTRLEDNRSLGQVSERLDAQVSKDDEWCS
ncbi:hypothetical protein ACFE04_013177 [Oxalis oulophora]